MTVYFALLSSGERHIAAELDGEMIADSLVKLMLQVRIVIPNDPVVFGFSCLVSIVMGTAH